MELQEIYDDIQDAGAEVIALSIDSEGDAVSIVEAHGLEFPVAYDTTIATIRAWEVFNLLGDGVSAPATYVFDSSGNLMAYRIGDNIADRPGANEVLSFLRAG